MDEAVRVIHLLTAQGKTLATAESCTGGLLGKLLTDVPGASAVYLGGVISYAYKVKEELLGVDAALLREKGAVCEEAALQMAQGARQRFGADFAYTLDGGAYGELEYENFNAASLKVDIAGKNIHPGSAKGRMKDAMTIGMAFERLLPPEQKPEFTEGYEGFFHLTEMSGDVEHCSMRYILRDHDARKLADKKAEALRAAEFLNARYGAGTVSLTIRDSYQNMAEQIARHRHLVDNAFEAIRRTGAEPAAVPIRGGTDGARLSFMGLPCPNLGTGGGNYHGKLEYCCVEEMDQAVECMKNLVELYSAR